MRELEWKPSVDSAGIGVAPNDGAITLARHVSSYVDAPARRTSEQSTWSLQLATKGLAGRATGPAGKRESTKAPAIDEWLPLLLRSRADPSLAPRNPRRRGHARAGLAAPAACSVT